MEKFFNTAGPSNPEKHYTLDRLIRINLPEILCLIAQERYFVLHAPRQTGKTSCLLALQEYLNLQTDYRCLYVNVETAQSARNDVYQGVRTILGGLASQARMVLSESFLDQHWSSILETYGPHQALMEVLSQWTQHSNKPTVLLVDEIDALVGDTLISVLRQLRAGYPNRPSMFPQTMILCGIRDVRDYRIQTSGNDIITGGSAFNIKSKSLRLGNFTREEVLALYQQHTTATGQTFEVAALSAAWNLTQGQPWLVNALGHEVTSDIKENRDRQLVITEAMLLRSKENLILRRDTHLDQLVDKLKEPRVHRIISAILSGEDETQDLPEDDILYVNDLGLIVSKPQLKIANPIYQEIIPRSLNYSAQVTITHQTQWYVLPNGELHMEKLLKAFQQFFREHSQHWIQSFSYQEAGPQLLLQAFLQRVVNGGGRIEREYGLGRKRTDLIIFWPTPTGEQRIVMELKILRKSLNAVLKEGLKQTWEYMDLSNATEGHLILFDRRPEISWEEKIFRKRRSYQKTPIRVWGM